MKDDEQIESVREALAKPFHPSRIHWRIGARTSDKSKGIALAYIDARDVMNRLDAVLGLDGWQSHFTETAGGRVLCELTCRIGDEWITRSDGAGATATEGEKGGISDALKRAAVNFGIGRYLYYLPNTWVPLIKDGRAFANEPQLPAWAQGGADDQPSGDAGPSEATRLKQHNAAVRENLTSIAYIKEGVAEDDPLKVVEAWSELDEGTQRDLWVAPTKGGIFTTEERTYLKGARTKAEQQGENA